jgi:hypothetical protein
MFFELVVHPWSWLVTVLGAPGAPAWAPPDGAAPVLDGTRGPGEGAVAFDVAFGEVAARLSCRRSPGLSGITHEAVIDAARGRVRVGGRYRIGQPWSFRVDVDRGGGWQQVGAGGPGAADPWYRANSAAIAAVVAVLRGAAPDSRLFDWDRALELDRLAQRRLHDGGWRW